MSQTLEHDGRDAAMQRLREVVRADRALRHRLSSRLPPAEKLRLAAEIAVAHVRIRRGSGSAPLPEQLAALRRGVSDPAVPAWQRPLEHVQAARIGRAVARMLPRLPGDTRCLSQSLVVIALLANRGVGSTLVIGVEPGSNFTAHAWVEHGGVPLLRADEPCFARLVVL